MFCVLRQVKALVRQSLSTCILYWCPLALCIWIGSSNCTIDCGMIEQRFITMSMCRYFLVLECKTRGKQLHLTKHFGSKRAFFSCKNGYKTNHHHDFCTPFCNWRRPFWDRNVLSSEAVYHMSYAQEPTNIYLWWWDMYFWVQTHNTDKCCIKENVHTVDIFTFPIIMSIVRVASPPNVLKHSTCGPATTCAYVPTYIHTQYWNR